MNFLMKNHEPIKNNKRSVRKKLVLTILTLTLFTFSFAQNIEFGAKAGLNYNFGGDLKQVVDNIGNNASDVISGAENKAGYHLGLWAKMDVLGFYIRPELIYTELNHSYANSNKNVSTDFSTKKIDIPILIGINIAGPVNIFAGPSFQYVTTSDFTQNDFKNIKKKDFSAGLQIGAGADFGRFGLDVRWEKGFSSDVDGEFLDTDINVDNRPNQIIFGLSYQLNKE